MSDITVKHITNAYLISFITFKLAGTREAELEFFLVIDYYPLAD